MMRTMTYLSVLVLLVLCAIAYAPTEMQLRAADNATVPPGTIPPATAVNLKIGASQGPFFVGDVIVFDIKLENISEQDLSNITVDVDVPQYTQFDEAKSSAGWQRAVSIIGGAADAPCTDSTTAGVTCSFNISLLEQGTSQTPQFAVKLTETVPADTGQLGIVATVEGAELTTSLPGTIDVQIFESLLVPVALHP